MPDKITPEEEAKLREAAKSELLFELRAMETFDRITAEEKIKDDEKQKLRDEMKRTGKTLEELE